MYVFDSWRAILVPGSPSCPTVLFHVHQMLFCTGVDILPSILLLSSGALGPSLKFAKQHLG